MPTWRMFERSRKVEVVETRRSPMMAWRGACMKIVGRSVGIDGRAAMRP